jgi:hypothetical protein
MRLDRRSQSGRGNSFLRRQDRPSDIGGSANSTVWNREGVLNPRIAGDTPHQRRKLVRRVPHLVRSTRAPFFFRSARSIQGARAGIPSIRSSGRPGAK